MYKYLFILMFLLWSCNKSNGNTDNGDNGSNSKTDSTEQITDTINENPGTPSDSIPPTTGNKSYYIYIGTYTGNGSKGIYRATFDTDSGTISTPELAATITNPSFQCISKDHRLLWSVTETSSGQVTGYLIDTISGNLTKTSTFSSLGDAPCYVSFDGNKLCVVTANYNSGNVTLIPVTADGMANGKAFSDQHTGKGPNSSRQSGPHAHCAKVDPTGKYIYSCDLGTDKIYVYTINNGTLSLFKTIITTPGSGPRHLDFHPQLKSMAVIHELDGTITTYLPDADGCFSVVNNTVSTLPDSYNGQKSCADIHFSSDGRFLYGSNRVHNSIALIRIDEATQQASVVDWQTSNLKTPRNFAIDPSGKYIIAVNQDGNSITVYKIDKDTG
jgi:6-phosphogluconolactonase